VLTPCGHSFCRSCISCACGSSRNGCPLCRGGLHDFDPQAAPSNMVLAAKMVVAVLHSVVAQHQSEEAPCKLEVVINSLHDETPSTGNRNTWSMWLALRGFSNKHMAAIVEKVVYEIDPSCKKNGVTTYPPLFSLCHCGSAPSMVRCRIHWAPMLGIRPTTVDHILVLEKSSNCTLRMIHVDRDALDTLELEVLKRVPSSVKQLQLREKGPGKLRGVGPGTVNALGLETPRRKTVEPPRFWVSPTMCKTQDGSLLEVVVGNLHRVLPWRHDGEPCHEWTMYVMLPGFQVSKPTMVKQVVYNLHPTFNPDTYTLQPPNFELTCTGSETFKVTCTIHWSPALGLQPTTLVHELIFEEGGGRTSATICVSPRRLQFFCLIS